MGPFGFRGGEGGGIGRGLVGEEVVPGEAGVALTALRVQDPEGRPPARRPVAVAGDECLRSLADDVASEPDPRAPGELEPDRGRLRYCGREATGEPGRFEDDEERLRPPGESSQPAESIGDPGGLVRGSKTAAGQVQDQQVHRAPGQQRATDGQAFIERLRRDDHEPLEVDPAGNGLDRVEAPRQVEPCDDRALRLRLGREAEDERGPAARPVAADRDAGRPGQAAGTEDRVERGEPGVDDPVVSGRAGDGMVDRGRRRGRPRISRRAEARRLSRGSMAGASARAPSVDVVTRGAAAPQRAWRLATAAVTSGERVAIGCSR